MEAGIIPRHRRASEASAGFESTGPFLLFDYHRAPYDVTGSPLRVPGTEATVASVGAECDGPRLHWVLPPARTRPSRWDMSDVPVVTRVLTDRDIAPVLAALGGGWSRRSPLTAVGDTSTASVWDRDDGSVLLPFDPDEAIRTLWTEAYLRALNPVAETATAIGRRAYYGVRDVLPRRLQIAFRRELARRQARTRFPRWPVESGLHDLYDALFVLVAQVTGRPVPTLSIWPAGRTWALVLTHDVEDAPGLAGIEPLRRVERRYGLVSAWNFVPERYDLPPSIRTDLVGEGCEIGVHGLRHDGHDIESLDAFSSRLPAIHRYARAWGATGFRAPSMQRSWEAMGRLGFDHDLSFPDTDPFQPCRGGCCTWWPFMNGSVVELPLTLPQDHTLFVILQHAGPDVWIDKSNVLRARGGLAQLLVHPDYVDVPATLPAYEAYLQTFAHDPAVWHALPSQVSAWWRDRSRSGIASTGSGWEAVGPAAATAGVVLRPEASGPSALGR